MLKQETRERLQALVHNPKFDGAVKVTDMKLFHDHNGGSPTYYVDVDIHANGFNVFTLLAELFSDLKLDTIESYETDHGDYATFGNFATGVIELAGVKVWVTHGKKEMPSKAMESSEEFVPLNSTTDTEVQANA